MKLMAKTGLLAILAAALCITAAAQQNPNDDPLTSYGSSDYAAVKKTLASGWNTWDTRSVLAHELLPECFELKLQLETIGTGKLLKEALIGRRGKDDEDVRPYAHTYDGTYSELTLKWQGINIRVQSAASGDGMVILITPEKGSKSGTLRIVPEMLYGRPGKINVAVNGIYAELPNRKVAVNIDGKNPGVAGTSDAPYITVSLDSTVGISAGEKKIIGDIKKTVEEAKQKFQESKKKYGDLTDLYDAMQSVLAWNVIYEPTKDRVITPVSRAWSVGWGGYVLFCWDTYFASYMLSLDNKQLAYANAIEITKEKTDSGFVPNFGGANSKSLDRSQPPVGSYIIREIYRHYKEKWFLKLVYDDLLTWNRWWEKNRMLDGLLCWGSNPYKGYQKHPGELLNVNQRMGAALESGLDNSPMYDEMPFNGSKHIMLLADVGLTSMYVMDCDALADIADELGKADDSRELRARAEKYRTNLARLWDDEKGFYYNMRMNKKELSGRISPTNFYPLLAKAPTAAQADRMMKEHFYNPSEFWGEWIIPSISRDDPDYPDNEYWRGRIWAPMNFLVYLGMRNYELPKARADLVAKSRSLILKSWLSEGHVYENYNSTTGVGDDVGSSDKFYHWGALLAFMSFIENGIVADPGKPMQTSDAK